jgi:hypothetical protein
MRHPVIRPNTIGFAITCVAATIASAASPLEAQDSTAAGDSLRERSSEIIVRAAAAPVPTTAQLFPLVANDSLELSWRAVSGMTIYAEINAGPYFKYRTTTSYAYVVSPSSDTTVEERLEQILVRTNGMPILQNPRKIQQVDQHFVLTLRAGAVSGTEVNSTRTSVSPTAPPYTFRMTTLNDTAEARSGPWTLGRKVPRGVIPRNFLRAGIASLPDSLPEQAIFWTVGADSSGIFVESDTVRFSKASEIDVPMSDGGAPCKRDTKTHKVRTKVTKERFSNRFGAAEYFVLAASPHLDIQKNLRCLSLPGVH